MRLDGVRHVREAAIGPALLDGPVQALAGDVQERLHPRGYCSNRQRERAVGVVPLDNTPEVEPDDVARVDLSPGRRYPVHDLLVDRDAGRRREPAVALEGGRGALPMDVCLDVLVDLERGHTRLHERAQALHDAGQDVTGPPHEGDLARRLEHDHRGALTAARIAARMVSTGPSPDTVTSWLRCR